MVFWHLWIGGARNPGPGPRPLGVEASGVGGWLTHGDLALEAPVDFLAVEHRVIPTRVRSEWAGLKCEVGWPQSGRQHVRNPPMLGMLGLKWLV